MSTKTPTSIDRDTVVVTKPAHYDAVTCTRFEARAPVSIAAALDAAEVDIAGPVSVDGPVNADTVSCSGTLGVTGPLHTDTLTVTGSIGVDGPTSAGRVSIEGAGQFADLATDELSVHGALEGVEISADTVEVHGAIDCRRIAADVVEIRGGIECDRLAADEVTLSLASESAVEAIEADHVTITRREQDGFLVADRVVGERIEVEHADVETVEGDVVTVGPGARIGTLRAARYDIDEDATVGEIVE
ncbi:hypothetical protein [Haloarchaeobius sp. DYHT-AS-18]|uniref:hypothetical protein n=1 Tax=Haloarchaeobius sp. DYHT-AS-18 TaxID=3446117 RepID=UPI003EBEDC02